MVAANLKSEETAKYIVKLLINHGADLDWQDKACVYFPPCFSYQTLALYFTAWCYGF